MARSGIYVEMAHHPQAIVDAMAGMEGAVTRTQVLGRVLRYLPFTLLAAGFVGFLATAQAENSLSVLFFAVFGTGLALVFVARRWQIPLLRQHFDVARQILHTLRDDTGRKGCAVGWLDLSGPQQKGKEVRRARSGGGKQKVYYRDPWLRVKFKLVDGSVLRLTLEDKVKTKAGSIVRHETQFSAKLVVNPELYPLGEVPRGAIPIKSATLTHEDGVLVLKGAGKAERFAAPRLLELLRTMYGQILDVEHPQPFYARLRDMAEEARQAQRAAQPDARLRQGLEQRGFEPSPRSDRLYYHPLIPDLRFALATRVVRLERRNRQNQRWDLVRSFSLARETGLALEAAESIATDL